MSNVSTLMKQTASLEKLKLDMRDMADAMRDEFTREHTEIANVKA